MRLALIACFSCVMHAAEGVKARLTYEGYPKDNNAQLVTMIWGWIRSPTLEA